MQPYNKLTTLAPVSVGTGATPLLTQAQQETLGLRGVIMQPASDIYIGDSTVTTASGILVAAGQTLDLAHYAGPIYGVCASGTVSVRVMLGAT
jgi:hypothetical protein